MTTCARPDCMTTAAVFTADEALCKPHHAADKTRPHPTDKDLFMNALGALLASTMPDEFDRDDCEHAC